MLVLLNDAPHYIGRALTFELQDENGKLLCNSICLSSKSIYKYLNFDAMNDALILNQATTKQSIITFIFFNPCFYIIWLII